MMQGRIGAHWFAIMASWVAGVVLILAPRLSGLAFLRALVFFAQLDEQAFPNTLLAINSYNDS